MAGLAHMGVGLAAKRVASKVPLAVLLAGAYAIDIKFIKENTIAPGRVSNLVNYYSKGGLF